MSKWLGELNHPDDAYRYEVHSFTISPIGVHYHRTPVLPRSNWQAREYHSLMGRWPIKFPDPQYQYNPRTKAGKALLEEMMGNG